MPEKTSQLQLRVSSSEKHAIRQAAKRAGMSMSQWVLSRLFETPNHLFAQYLDELIQKADPQPTLAHIHDYLVSLTANKLSQATHTPPPAALSPHLQNTLAAMVEHRAHQLDVRPPAWVNTIAPLNEPYFATNLKKLRTHLLLNAPIAFKKRNLFVDSTLGTRV